MDFKYEFGTKEYYIDYGRKEGRVEGEQNKEKKYIENLTNYLMKNENLSFQDANQKAKIMLNFNLDE